MKGRYRHDIPLDLSAPLPPQPKPPVREPVKRVVQDELTAKQKASRDYWSRN